MRATGQARNRARKPGASPHVATKKSRHQPRAGRRHDQGDQAGLAEYQCHHANVTMPMSPCQCHHANVTMIETGASVDNIRISGSGVANVMAVGSITIPTMIRA
jgi:hypothetical protein